MCRYITILLLFFTPLSAFADASSDAHIKSAFIYAKRAQWENAISEARAAHSKILTKYFTWEFLRDPGSDANFDEITEFMEENPDWPDKNLLERHAEAALMANNPSDETLSKWFAKHPPLSIRAKMKTVRNEAALQTYIRAAWITDDYDKKTEAELLEKYHAILRSSDHISRIDRLLWEGKDEEAKRLFKYAPSDYQRLFQARLSLAEDKLRAPLDVLSVPRELKLDPGLTFERIKWRMRDDDKTGVRELLLLAPNEVPYPEKWWVLRDRQIREAIGENNLKLAQQLLAHHGQKPGTQTYKEAQWLEGWLNLEYLNKTDKAYSIFSTLFDDSETPGGKAQAAYWAGRASERSAKGNASQWYIEASHYPTTFYGQLATWEINKHGHINIVSDGSPRAEEKENYKKRELVQLVYALNAAQESDAAGKFIFYLADNAKTSGDAVLAASLGRDIQRIDFSVRAAKKILQNDVVALSSGWPVISVPKQTIDGEITPEKPLLLGLIRQESEFNTDAESSSGAYGLMQLLPGTAKETAHKAGLSYKAGQLFEPNYNMMIGSLYLGKLLTKFDGSYVFSIASYNAGPGRVQQWTNEYGTPAHNVRSVVDWVEKIPTSETRQYVKRVLENIQVYRFVLAGNKSSDLTIGDDLIR